MSKAFELVNKKTLIQQLEKVFQPGEINLLSIFTNRPLIAVSLDGEQGEGFNTYVGIFQADCLSVIFLSFIYHVL